MEDSTKNYEAKINGMWYPVEIISDEYGLFPMFLVVDVGVKMFRTWDGRVAHAYPFSSYSMGGPVDNDYGWVRLKNIRETTDDPLTTVYPKKN